MLLRQGIVIFRQQTVIQDGGEGGDPFVVERMENPSLDAGPIVDRHDVIPSGCGCLVHYTSAILPDASATYEAHRRVTMRVDAFDATSIPIWPRVRQSFSPAKTLVISTYCAGNFPFRGPIAGANCRHPLFRLGYELKLRGGPLSDVHVCGDSRRDNHNSETTDLTCGLLLILLSTTDMKFTKTADPVSPHDACLPAS